MIAMMVVAGSGITAGAAPVWSGGPAEGRTVLVDWRPDEAQAVPDFSVVVSAAQAAKSYAVHVEGEGEWALFINGRASGDALMSKTGAWFQIPASALAEGSNSVIIGGGSAATGVTIFSLDNSIEEAHFGRFAAGPALFAQPPTDPSQDLMDVLHCDLRILLNMASATITSATLTMTAESLAPGGLAECVLDLNDNGGALLVSAVEDGAGNPLVFNQSFAQNRVFITLSAPVAMGNTFTVRVFYAGTPVSSTSYRRTTHSGVPLIYTNSQAYNARNWWPCKDIPADKFTIDLHVKCPDTEYSGYPLFVVSNGALTGVDHDVANNRYTYHWSESYPIATQYVSITCTNYRVSADVYTALDTVTTMSVAHYVYPESYASEAGEVVRTVEVVEHFASLFGEYPFLSEKYATSTWGLSYGLEHQTCTSMPNGNLATPYHRRNIHELAHMWFGTSVGNITFDHLWISEGWASYCEALWLEHKNGLAAYHARMLEYHDYNPAAADSQTIVNTNADAFTLSTFYYKGAYVLHMLRHVIGDTAFFAGAKSYCEDPAIRTGVADSDDAQAHFEAAWGQPLDWFFDQWLHRADRPVYSWTWYQRTVGGDTLLELRIEQTQGGGLYEMPIDFRANLSVGGPVNFTVWNDASPQFFSVNLGPGATVTSLVFDPDSWLWDYNSGSVGSFQPLGLDDWTVY